MRQRGARYERDGTSELSRHSTASVTRARVRLQIFIEPRPARCMTLVICRAAFVDLMSGNLSLPIAAVYQAHLSPLLTRRSPSPGHVQGLKQRLLRNTGAREVSVYCKHCYKLQTTAHAGDSDLLPAT